MATSASRQRRSRTALSPRELQVLGLIVQGLTNKEIAAELGVRTITVNTFVRRLYMKLNVVNRASATALAIRQGLI